ncbi:MAG TPA: DUF4870 domain-containing protein [Salinimicrobium sp.]|nr:DUF4870 domain-containing protein [Salinimicrobium sp.]
MDSVTKNPDTSLGAFVHLSTFSKYIIPFGNFIFPLIIWTARRKESFIDEHGRQALNFQISTFLYFIFIISATISAMFIIAVNMGISENFIFHEEIEIQDLSAFIPFMVTLAISGVLLLGLFVLEIFGVISATVKAGDGKLYKYPLSISFIKSSNQSKNEQFNNTKNETL